MSSTDSQNAPGDEHDEMIRQMALESQKNKKTNDPIHTSFNFSKVRIEKKESLSIRVSARTIDYLRELAHKNHVTLSATVGLILDEVVEKEIESNSVSKPS